MSFEIDHIYHPDYISDQKYWEEWRYVYKGGKEFVEKYLEQYSSREDKQDFAKRKKITYSPSFAKAAVKEIKKSIFERMIDIQRLGGSKNYQSAIKGDLNGVDLLGSSMDLFMGDEVLDELLPMRRVGIYVDMPRKVGPTILNNTNKHPYLYIYRVEDICSWYYDETIYPNEYLILLLRDWQDIYNEATGLPIGRRPRYRLIKKLIEENKVLVTFFDEYIEYNEQQQIVKKEYREGEQILLNIPRIPFIMPDIGCSLLEDIAAYQIAHLNLASADIHYALKANFPFYVEQDDGTGISAFTKDGTEKKDENGNIITTKQAVGPLSGRKYTGDQAPSFIHPSPEPLKVSMEKQALMKEEIHQLINIALTNVSPVHASAESKKEDKDSIKTGLAAIGIELEYAEREIAKIWAMYENETSPANVKYPQDYTIKTESDRIEEGKSIKDLMFAVPSPTYQKHMGIRLAKTMLSHRVTNEEFQNIEQEIKTAKTMTSDPEVISTDLEAGLVSLETASQARGYPKGEVEKAKLDHAERLARIAEAQTLKGNLSNNENGNGLKNPASRGVMDQSMDMKESKEEKMKSRDTTMDDVVMDKTRGMAK